MNIEDIAFTNKHELEQVEKYEYVVVGDSAVRAKEMQWLLAERDRLAAENAELREHLAKYAHAVGEGHPIPCDLGPLCPYCYIDRLTAENAELRAKLDPDALTICYMSGQATGDAEARSMAKKLRAANATLDELREVVRNGFNNKEVAQRVVAILYPQPAALAKENTND